MTQVGSIIDEKYRVIDQIGEGGMSVVWLVTDSRLNKQWAIKEIKKNARTDTHKVIVDSLRKEANLMKGLDHPALPRIVDIIEDGESLFVVMDFIQGDDLKTVLQEGKRKITEQDVVDWGIQLCDALSYLHEKGVVYRDMKPGNVMLQSDGTVKIIDFGIAREYDPGKQDDTMPLGTRGYASPEAFKKGEQTDARSDVYSLGVTLFHLVTGHGPLEYVDQPMLPPIRSIDPSLSEGLEAVIIRATQWERNVRYQSCLEMSYDLEHLDELTLEHRRGLKRTLNLFKGLAIAGLACVVVGVGCLFGSSAVRASSFDGLMAQAAVAGTEETNGEASPAEQAYLDAMSVDSSRMEPYVALVDPTDGVYISSSERYPFSETESDRWGRLMSDNESVIAPNPQYADLCYDAGMIYFYYYDAHGSQFGQMEAAAEWFGKVEAACKPIVDSGGTLTETQAAQYNAAVNYLAICNFEKKHSNASAIGTEREVTTDYFAALKDNIDNLDESLPAIVQLRLCDAAYTALSASYLDELRDGNFSRANALALLDGIANCASRFQGRTDLGTSVAEIEDKLPKPGDDTYNAIKERIDATYGGRYWDNQSTSAPSSSEGGSR